MSDEAPKLISSLTGELMSTKLVEIAPGEWVPSGIHPDDVPRFGLVRMMRQPDGTYLPVLKTHTQYVRMHRGLPAALGFKDMSAQCLYRLMDGEFVQCSRPSPGVVMVDLGSLAGHIEAARDPEFWTPERLDRWSKACAATKRFKEESPRESRPSIWQKRTGEGSKY
jgi:hypothetical protein